MLTVFSLFGILLFSGAVQEPTPRVVIVVENRGTMVAELYPKEAPQTVSRFLALVRQNFYDGVRFHRVENNPKPFIVVTGDPLTKTLPIDDSRIGTGGSGVKIPFEKNDVQFLNGTLGLVRDQRDKNSGDSQFFICNGNQRFLEGTYVAFGRVVEGLDVIPKIQLGDKVVSIREKK
jgi:cyclophilin family peptidyl-prolyl cis-trans isomerase